MTLDLGLISDFLFPPPDHVGPSGTEPYALVFDVLLSLYRLALGAGLTLTLDALSGLAIA